MTDTILISKPIGALAYVVHDDEPRFRLQYPVEGWGRLVKVCDG